MTTYSEGVMNYCTTRRIEGARVKVVQAECRKHFDCEPSESLIGKWLREHKAARANNLQRMMRAWV